MVLDTLYAPAAKERELLRPQWVERLLDQPNAQRTRTGANSLWVLTVLEMSLQQQRAGYCLRPSGGAAGGARRKPLATTPRATAESGRWTDTEQTQRSRESG